MLGRLARMRGDAAAARDHYRLALKLYGDVSDQPSIATVLDLRVELALDEGQVARGQVVTCQRRAADGDNTRLRPLTNQSANAYRLLPKREATLTRDMPETRLALGNPNGCRWHCLSERRWWPIA